MKHTRPFLAVILSSLLAFVGSGHAAEPVDMTKRTEELKNLRWGMFICWSYSDYLGAVKFGNIFSIDVGPDYNGKLRPIDAKTLQQGGEMIKTGAAPEE